MQQPETIDRTSDPTRRLSEVFDTHGHRIERFPGNVLRITSTTTKADIPEAEATKVAAWYWPHVGARE